MNDPLQDKVLWQGSCSWQSNDGDSDADGDDGDDDPLQSLPHTRTGTGTDTAQTYLGSTHYLHVHVRNNVYNLTYHPCSTCLGTLGTPSPYLPTYLPSQLSLPQPTIPIPNPHTPRRHRS